MPSRYVARIYTANCFCKIGLSSNASYFSKEVIPFTSETCQRRSDGGVSPVLRHAYPPDALATNPAWSVGTLEAPDQLQFLKNDRKVLRFEVDAKGRQSSVLRVEQLAGHGQVR